MTRPPHEVSTSSGGGDLCALHTYTLHTKADGTIAGRAWTNDDEDQGYPTVESAWDVRYRDLTHAKKATGGCHFGINGCRVTVLFDGREFPST